MTVTNPGRAAAIVARAHNTGGVPLTANTWTKIPLDTIDYDTASLVSTVNGRLQIQTAGYYQMQGAVTIVEGGSATATNLGVAIYRNGSTVLQNQGIPTIQTAFAVEVTDVIQCVAGDFLELWVYNSQATSVAAGPAGTFISLSFIGR